MCAVSAVSDYYTNTWPNRFPSDPTPWQADPEVARLLKEAIERLDKIDKRLNDRECNEEAKQKFLIEIGVKQADG